jgi:hypothetical protein
LSSHKSKILTSASMCMVSFAASMPRETLAAFTNAVIAVAVGQIPESASS